MKSSTYNSPSTSVWIALPVVLGDIPTEPKVDPPIPRNLNLSCWHFDIHCFYQSVILVQKDILRFSQFYPLTSPKKNPIVPLYSNALYRRLEETD